MNNTLGEIENYMDAKIVAPEDAQPANKRQKKGPVQTKLTIKPEYYGLKINECELTLRNMTILEIITKFDFKTWVVGRDEALGKKAVPHYHIHFKSSKTIEALRKQKQLVLPNWGRSTKLSPPSSDKDNWYCWAGYATKEQIIGMSNDITDEDKIEIAKHAHTQATIKQSKLNWSNKKDEQKEQKKDLESRIYEILDKEYLGKTFPVVGMSDLAQIGVTFSKAYFEEVGELPPGTTLKSKVWKYAITRKIAPMEFYVHQFF